MDRSERVENPHIAILNALQGAQADIWTALPGFVQSFDPAQKTCEVQPGIQAQVTSPVDGSKTWVNLPLLLDCPVYFPSGGGCTLTFPIKQNDECLVIFSSRCIDAWWQSGTVDQQAVLRMHDLSDGFVFVGISSQPKVIPNLSLTSVQLRTDDGLATVSIDPSSHAITAATTGAITLTAPLVTINGGLHVNGAIKATEGVAGANVNLDHHIHSGVQAGLNNSGEPLV